MKNVRGLAGTIEDYFQYRGCPIKLNDIQNRLMLGGLFAAHRRSGLEFGWIQMVIAQAFTYHKTAVLIYAPNVQMAEQYFDSLNKSLKDNQFQPTMSQKRPFKLGFSNGSVIRIVIHQRGKFAERNYHLRGQQAELIVIPNQEHYLSDEEFENALKMLKPIIEGDAYQATVPLLVITGRQRLTKFFKHFPSRPCYRYSIENNPDWSQERKEMIRDQVSSREWQEDWLLNEITEEPDGSAAPVL